MAGSVAFTAPPPNSRIILSLSSRDFPADRVTAHERPDQDESEKRASNSIHDCGVVSRFTPWRRNRGKATRNSGEFSEQTPKNREQDAASDDAPYHVIKLDPAFLGG